MATSAGTLSVKVELDASDVPGDLTRAVNQAVRPALNKVESQVDQSARNIKKSVDGIGPALGGVGSSIGKSVRPALRDVERDVDRSMGTVRNSIAGVGGAFAGLAGKFGGPAAGIASAAGGVSSGLAGISTAGSAAATGLLAAGAAAAASIAAVAAIGAAAAVVGKQFYDLGSAADDLNDKLTIKTGGSVEEIEALRDSVQKLGTTSVPLDFGKIADVAVDVTRNLKLAGPALEEVSSRLANLGRLTGEAVNVKALGDAFKKFGVEGKDQVAFINELNALSQETGLSFNTLTQSLDSSAAALQNSGLSFSESIGLLGQLSNAGLDAQEVLPGITKLLREAPKLGLDGQTALQKTVEQIQALSEQGPGGLQKAKELADKLFGRSSLPLFEAIKRGQIDLNNLNFTGPVEDVNELSNRTADWSERWQTLKNTIAKALEPLGTAVFDKVNEQLGTLADWITANQDAIVLFFVNLGKAFIDIGSAALRGVSEATRALGYLIAPIGDVLGALATVDAAISDALGNEEDAAASRRKAESFFGWGESLTAVGEAGIEASKGADAAKAGLDRIGDSVRGATAETSLFGDQLSALPVDGVLVPVEVGGIPEADAALNELFGKYSTLSVGVNLGGAAGTGSLAGPGMGGSLPGFAGAGRTGSNQGLTPNSVQAKSAVEAAFPDISTIGGWRPPDGFNEHFNGQALDIMIPNWASPSGKSYGDSVAKYLLNNSAALGVDYVLWQGKQWNADGTSSSMGDRGSPRENHMDHVHAHTVNTPNLPGASGVKPPTGSTGSLGLGTATSTPNVPSAASGTTAGVPGVPSVPGGAVTPGMPPVVDPGAAPVPPAPPITVAPVEVSIIPQFTAPTDDPVLNELQAQADARKNEARQAAANKAATAAAQTVADADAKVKAAQAERDTVFSNELLYNPENRAKADEELLKSTKALTDAQTAQAELLSGQQTDTLNDQIEARKQANAASKTKAEPFDYSSLPLGDPMRIASGAFLGAGGTMEEFAALVGGKPDAAAASATASVLQGAAQPFGAVAGDAIAAAVAPSLIPTGTPTAPDTDTTTLLAERNPAVLGALAGYDVPDYTRQGGDPGEVTRSGGVTASGAITSDIGALIDRTMTNMEAANKARQDQLLAILAQIKQQVATEVLSPIVEAAVAAAMTGIAADMGTAMGETAGPIIGADTAAAVAAANSESSSSGTGAIPGMAGGGGIYGGTPGKDSVPAMLMPGEFVLTAADVARMGGFAGVQRLIGGLQANGRIQYFATGGGVGRATTGNPQGGQNVNSTVGADFFGVSQIPVLALAINALTEVLLTLIGVEILQRDALIEVGKEFKEFRGDFQAFDAAGRIKNDNSGLSDRTSSSEKQAADERLRILKLVINGIVKYVIEKILVPLGKAIGNAIVSALAGAAGGAISGGGGSIAGGIASAAISAAGAVAIDLAAEVFTIAAETFIDIGLEAIGEFLQTIFPNLTTTLLGGAALEQIAGPVSAVMTGAIGVITSGIGNLMGNLGGLFAGILPALQGFLAGFAPLTLTLSSVVGVLSSIAAVLQQIFGGLVSLGASIAAPIVAAVTSVLGGFTSLNVSMAGMTNVLASIAAILQQIFGSLFNLGSGIVSPITSAVSSAVSGFMPLVSNLTTTTNALGGVAQVLTGLAPNLGSVVSSFGTTGAALSTAMGGIATLAGAVNPPRATVNPVAAAAASTVSTVNQLTAALTAGVIRPNTTTTVNAPITVMSATAATPRRIANRLQRLTG